MVWIPEDCLCVTWLIKTAFSLSYDTNFEVKSEVVPFVHFYCTIFILFHEFIHLGLMALLSFYPTAMTCGPWCRWLYCTCCSLCCEWYFVVIGWIGYVVTFGPFLLTIYTFYFQFRCFANCLCIHWTAIRSLRYFNGVYKTTVFSHEFFIVQLYVYALYIFCSLMFTVRNGCFHYASCLIYFLLLYLWHTWSQMYRNFRWVRLVWFFILKK
jgi:hypothetical protein